MENQDLDLIGKTVGNMPYKIGIVDQNGNLKNQFVAKASTNRIDIPEQMLSGSGSTGGSTGGNTGGADSNHPSAGADYYAGSLADGEITQRKLEWSGTDDPTKSNKITFADDPGTKLFGQFDGITILGHIQKTVMTKGVLGAVTSVPINYDPKNVVKAGYFTTTAPYPLYIKTASLPVGQKVPIQITGTGEHLSGKNVKAPILSLTFNVDKTMTIEHTAGYDNDGDAAGATGANYQYVVDRIATFSKQNAFAQLPPSVNLFSGSASGDITLTGPSNYFENVMDGIEITFGQYATANNIVNDLFHNLNKLGNYRLNVSDIGIRTIRIGKEDLIIGNKINLLSKLKFPSTINNFEVDGGGYGWNKWSANVKFDSIDNNLLIVKENSVINLGFNIIVSKTDGTVKTPFKLNVSKVTTYKD
ncbi:hypothetical protein FD33_GL000011 [Companilactobacillus paralimentarius DSM 13238 = JCM 10415]|uniref:Uncharacterized protein n=1 Tax=Companilactobacillus paralimentarius DSM 13238 = JCM 10415 TaxID=1122151 RepID=A0A0R1PQW0_9LACO|nr:hypothetical protein [Companilactobacillus paralimentarius]KAE9563257.1 hypothetical protein ATN96_11085 [Companilactobacillus paralimentarius]KRL32580.1 hypothetical protein FD33_GL000011 [Companilactobacillus paralimentarius DSM 13238 = JCM 10415]